jgi:hypothetical protein
MTRAHEGKLKARCRARFALCIAAIALINAGPPDSGGGLKTGDPFPRFSVLTIDGKVITNMGLRGTVVWFEFFHSY